MCCFLLNPGKLNVVSYFPAETVGGGYETFPIEHKHYQSCAMAFKSLIFTLNLSY